MGISCYMIRQRFQGSVVSEFQLLVCHLHSRVGSQEPLIINQNIEDKLEIFSFEFFLR